MLLHPGLSVAPVQRLKKRQHPFVSDKLLLFLGLEEVQGLEMALESIKIELNHRSKRKARMLT